MKFLKSPENLTKDEAKSSVRSVSLWSILGGLGIFAALFWWLGTPLEFESPLFLIQQSIRVGLAGFPVAILRALLTISLGFFAANVVENTEFGQRLTTHAKGFVYAAIWIAVALAFNVK